MLDFIYNPPLWGYLLAGIIGTALWRLIGVGFVGTLNEDSRLFQWVTLVAYAMTAALLMRVVLIPADKADLFQGGADFMVLFAHIWPRLIPFFIAFLAWYLTGKKVMIGLLFGIGSFALIGYLSNAF